MHMIKVYHYRKCSTCCKAIKFLQEREIPYREVEIAETAPTLDELRQMLYFQKGNVKKLFNTSGRLYKELGLKDKLPGMSTDEALTLLEGKGMLVKRPFVIFEGGGLLGFKEDDWEKGLSEEVHAP
jgi:arsenate reductase